MSNIYPTIISYYTDDWLYPHYANKLANKCKKLGLNYNIEKMPSSKDWIKNCAVKPMYILNTLEKLKTPVLWVDVDGDIYKRPDWLSKHMDSYDFMARARVQPNNLDRIWHVGTMYFNYTRATMDFVKAWVQLHERKGYHFSDDQSIDWLWKSELKFNNLRYASLPWEYFEILKSHDSPPKNNTVVAHRASTGESKKRYMENRKKKK